MKLTIHDFDGNSPCGAWEPMEISLLKQLSAVDDWEYWLGKPSQTIHYVTEDVELEISHVIVSPGLMGTSFKKPFQKTRVNLAYVTDQAVVASDKLDFAHADYVAIGTGSIQ